MYLDSFLKVAKLEDADITATIKELNSISKAFNVNFILSVSLDKEELPAELAEYIFIEM